jgi:hypothetical protein
MPMGSYANKELGVMVHANGQRCMEMHDNDGACQIGSCAYQMIARTLHANGQLYMEMHLMGTVQMQRVNCTHGLALAARAALELHWLRWLLWRRLDAGVGLR